MKQKNWFKPKAFTHLTQKLSQEDGEWIKNYVSEYKNIKEHKFYPLIHKTIAVRRFKKSRDKKGAELKRHYTIENGKKKSNVKYREIFYPNHLDAHIYSYYTHKILEPLYEVELKKTTSLNNSILAYRRIPLPDNTRCKCNIDFANDVFEEIKNSKGSIAVLALDISKFFDSLDHKILKKSWTNLLGRKDLDEDHYNIYKSITNFSYVEMKSLLDEFEYKHLNTLIKKDVSYFIKDGVEFRNKIKSKGYIKKNPFRRKEKNQEGVDVKTMIGIPQGTPISAFLANLYLLEFDKKALLLVKNCDGLYRRYSDDILILCPKEIHETIALEFYKLIKEFKLVIQPIKTQCSFFTNGKLEKGQKPVTYLGFQFDGHRKLLKTASISKFYRKMKKNVKYRGYRASKSKQKIDKGILIDATLHRKKLYEQFSFLGADNKSFKKRNYISYANFSSRIMNSPEINNQLSQAWKILHAEIDKQEKKYNLPSIQTPHLSSKPRPGASI
jgi:hypothetical protein